MARDLFPHFVGERSRGKALLFFWGYKKIKYLREEKLGAGVTRGGESSEQN